MKSLLRDLNTGKFYRKPGMWVESHFEATEFEDPEGVWSEAQRLAQANLEVLVVDDNGQPAWGSRINGPKQPFSDRLDAAGGV